MRHYGLVALHDGLLIVGTICAIASFWLVVLSFQPRAFARVVLHRSEEQPVARWVALLVVVVAVSLAVTLFWVSAKYGPHDPCNPVDCPDAGP